jgi:hypothetical protein
MMLADKFKELAYNPSFFFLFFFTLTNYNNHRILVIAWDLFCIIADEEKKIILVKTNGTCLIFNHGNV